MLSLYTASWKAGRVECLAVQVVSRFPVGFVMHVSMSMETCALGPHPVEAVQVPGRPSLQHRTPAHALLCATRKTNLSVSCVRPLHACRMGDYVVVPANALDRWAGGGGLGRCGLGWGRAQRDLARVSNGHVATLWHVIACQQSYCLSRLCYHTIVSRTRRSGDSLHTRAKPSALAQSTWTRSPGCMLHGLGLWLCLGSHDVWRIAGTRRPGQQV